MSLTAERRLKLRLDIPPEASNSLSNKEHELDKCKEARIMIARERRISLFTRILEPSLTESFYFLYYTAENGSITSEEAVKQFRSFLLRVNKMKPLPKFIALCGGLMNMQLEKHHRATDGKIYLEDALSFLDSQVKVIYVASSGDFRQTPNKDCIDDYKNCFGDDWYGFWVCGIAFLVVNTVYFRKDLDISLEVIREEQNDWIESELLQQQIFQAKRTIILQDCAPRAVGFDKKENEQANSEEWLRKYEIGGVSHLLCRGSYEEQGDEFEHHNIKILPNQRNDKVKSCVRLLKVSSDDIYDKIYAPENLPEDVYL